MSRQLADQILQVQAELARLRDRHSGPEGDRRTLNLLDEAEALLAQAVGLHADPKTALRAARTAVMSLGATLPR